MTEGIKKLIEVQTKLKAPKNQLNKFGGYNYRSCEDILEAVKPLLATVGASVVLSDEIITVGARVYVKATATFKADDYTTEATAYAREPEDKKGMDASQITGTASSYARKYALNGLFLIDDTRDADATNTHGHEPKAKEGQNPKETPEQKYTNLLRTKGIYSESLHLAFNRMTVEEQRQEYKRVTGL